MCNLVAVQIADLRLKALVDSGSMLSLISNSVFNRLKKIDEETSSRSFDYRFEKPTMMAANKTALKVLASIDTQLQIGGVALPLVLHVVENLAYDLILGLDILQQTGSAVSFVTNTLSLYDGLIEVPMMRAVSASTVYTVCNVTIPAMSRSILEVKAPRVKLNMDFYLKVIFMRRTNH
jgi:gag-polyprotein putative aspartyl protease